MISGSDIWRGWQSAGDGAYSHAWPYDWGEEPNPWIADGVEVGPLARRHEPVFVDGALLRQVLAPAELAPGTFLVDEGADRIVVRPRAGVDLRQATVEVGVRRRLLQAQHGSGLTARGLTFQHSAEVLESAAVLLSDVSNVVLEDCTFRWNNAVGLKILSSRNVTVRRSAAISNGIDGMSAYKAGAVLLEDTVTAYNNWRGGWGGLYGWAIGQKFMHVHGAVIRRHRSIGNLTRGFWLDTDNVDVAIEDSVFRDNRRDGLFVEANNGPIAVRSSLFAGNGAAGLLVAHSRQVTLDGNSLCSNLESRIEVTGTAARAGSPTGRPRRTSMC